MPLFLLDLDLEQSMDAVLSNYWPLMKSGVERIGLLDGSANSAMNDPIAH